MRRAFATTSYATPAKSAAGFTIMELLVAIVILSLACAIVFESFVSVTSTTDLARAEAARLRERQFIWRSLSENFNAIYCDAACAQAEFALTGEDNSGPSGPGDTITFCTSLPMPGSDALPGELRGVTYEVVGPEGADAATPTAGFTNDAAATVEPPAYLVITEYPVVHDTSDGVSVEDEQDDSRTRVRQIPIAGMDITYYDAESEDWVDDWDSTEAQHLPWAIEVMINLARMPEEEQALGADPGEPDLDMTFVLPLGAGAKEPFVDPNHYYIDPNSSGDPNSIFNDDKKGGKGGSGSGGGSRGGSRGGGSNRNYK